MKKIADIQLYGFLELHQALKKKFPRCIFDDGDILIDGYFQISGLPPKDRAQGEIVLEVFNPLGSDCDLDSLDISSQTLTIGFFVTEVDTFKYIIEKKLLDDEKIITEIDKLIGQVAPIRKDLPDREWNNKVTAWAKEIIEASPFFPYLIELED